MDISKKAETFLDTFRLYVVIHEAPNKASTISIGGYNMENTAKIYGYARVSSREQNLDRQIQALQKYVHNERDIIIDKASGKDFNRKGYDSLKNSLLRQGDTLVIKELDRLGRDYEGLKREWYELTSKGIQIVVIDTPMLNTANKSESDTKFISNIVFELLTYLAEKERIKIKQRQREGIDKALAKGVSFGRPKVNHPSNWDIVYTQWRNNEITAVEAMNRLGLKRSTFYKLVQLHEAQNKDSC